MHDLRGIDKALCNLICFLM